MPAVDWALRNLQGFRRSGTAGTLLLWMTPFDVDSAAERTCMGRPAVALASHWAWRGSLDNTASCHVTLHITRVSSRCCFALIGLTGAAAHTPELEILQTFRRLCTEQGCF